MSQLIVVRHGQAAAFSEDSDRLTPLGERQAAVLGEYWVKRGVSFDEVIVGGLRRHAQTSAVPLTVSLAAHARTAAL
jgi:broad specificity phosphatase PhoE